MNAARRFPLRADGLPVALLIALVGVGASVLFELPYLAATIGPGLWIALQGGRRACLSRPA